MKPNSGAREFWIEFGGDPSDDKEVYKRYCAAVPFEPSGFSDEVIHVIEKSAFDEIKAQADKLAEALEFYANPDSWDYYFLDKNQYGTMSTIKNDEMDLDYIGGCRARASIAEYRKFRGKK